MSEEEIFEHLFKISKTSDDKGGIVTSSLVRDGSVIADGISTASGIHSEYALLLKLHELGIYINDTDVVYTTVEPCGKRSAGGPGEKMGDCTTNLIREGIKRIIYAAADPDASQNTRHKFTEAGAALIQTTNNHIIHTAKNIFNSSVSGDHESLP